MDFELTVTEARVIGSLIEKEITTPQYYPMTLNALTNACNQKSNRNPVMSLEETICFRALEQLMEKGFVRRVVSDDSRVPKYREVFTEHLGLTPQQIAVACVLMLRGPQTVGEIRGRTERLFKFETLDEVSDTIAGIEGSDSPWVKKLPRLPGTKESRYAHLFSGEPEVEEVEFVEPAAMAVRSENERMNRLEEEVAALKETVATLVERLDAFQKQFE